MKTSPLVGLSSAPIMFSSVDLPEPDGPTIEIISPLFTPRVTPSSATVGTAPPYTFFTLSRYIA